MAAPISTQLHRHCVIELLDFVIIRGKMVSRPSFNLHFFYEWGGKTFHKVKSHLHFFFCELKMIHFFSPFMIIRLFLII